MASQVLQRSSTILLMNYYSRKRLSLLTKRYEVGKESELGAVDVMTGIYTGRSPKDKYIVVDENSKDTVWWTSDEYKNDNHPMSEDVWAKVKDIAKAELNKKLFVVDAFCGANKDTRMAVRFIVEVAWLRHIL